MQSITTLHKAGSAASTPQRVSSSKIDHRGSASNSGSRNTPSRIPTATRRVSSSTDSSFTECSSLSTVRSLKGKQRAQENPTDDSELIHEIKMLEGYKVKAISVEKQATSLFEENNSLRSEIGTLKNRSKLLENEIESLRHNLGECRVFLGEQEIQLANEKARADGFASELETKAQNDITNIRHAAEQLEASQTECIVLTQQLEAEKAARNADSKVLQSQVDTIVQENANLQQELQEQLAEKQKFESDLKELRSAHQREQRQRLELKDLYTELDGLVESMRRFAETLEEIKQRQHDTNTQIATLNGSTEEEREQLRRDHLDVLGQYRSHIDNIRELGVIYTDCVLEGHIATLQELIQRNNDAQETGAVWEALVLDRLEEFIETINRPKDDTLDELRHELAKATAAMNLLYSQQSPQADHQGLNPPSSPIIAISSSQAPEKEGQTQFGFTRRKGEWDNQPTCITKQRLSGMRPIRGSDIQQSRQSPVRDGVSLQ